MRFDTLQSFISREASSILDCKRPLQPCCFQLTHAVFTSRPSPVPLRVRVHPLVRLPSLQSPSSIQARPIHRSGRTTFPESSAPFATPAKRIYLPAGFPQPTYVPPSAFPTLSTVCSSFCLASLFHPAATSGIHLSGFFPAVQVGRLVGGLCPLVVRLRSSHQRVAPLIPTPGAPPTGLCSKQRSVANNRGFSPILARYPLKFSLSQACLRSP